MLFHFVSSSDVQPGDHLYRWRYFKLYQGIAVEGSDDASEIFVVVSSPLNGFHVVTLQKFEENGFLRRALYDQGDSYLHAMKLSGTSFVERKRPTEEIVRNARLLLDVNNINLELLGTLVAPGPNNFARLCCTMSHEIWRTYLQTAEHISSPVESTAQASALISAKLDDQHEVKELEDKQRCPICMDQTCNVAFSCGHLTCSQCARALKKCHICRKEIRQKIPLFWP